MGRNIQVLEATVILRSPVSGPTQAELLALLHGMGVLSITLDYGLTAHKDGRTIKFRVRPPYGSGSAWLRINQRRLQEFGLNTQILSLSQTRKRSRVKQTLSLLA